MELVFNKVQNKIQDLASSPHQAKAKIVVDELGVAGVAVSRTQYPFGAPMPTTASEHLKVQAMAIPQGIRPLRDIACHIVESPSVCTLASYRCSMVVRVAEEHSVVAQGVCIVAKEISSGAASASRVLMFLLRRKAINIATTYRRAIEPQQKVLNV